MTQMPYFKHTEIKKYKLLKESCEIYSIVRILQLIQMHHKEAGKAPNWCTQFNQQDKNAY